MEANTRTREWGRYNGDNRPCGTIVRGGSLHSSCHCKPVYSVPVLPSHPTGVTPLSLQSRPVWKALSPGPLCAGGGGGSHDCRRGHDGDRSPLCLSGETLSLTANWVFLLRDWSFISFPFPSGLNAIANVKHSRGKGVSNMVGSMSGVTRVLDFRWSLHQECKYRGTILYT